MIFVYYGRFSRLNAGSKIDFKSESGVILAMNCQLHFLLPRILKQLFVKLTISNQINRMTSVWIKLPYQLLYSHP